MKDFLALLAAIGMIWIAVAIGPSFTRWANRSLDAAAPATTCTCPPAPMPPVATPGAP